jgi:hypothetical protein
MLSFGMSARRSLRGLASLGVLPDPNAIPDLTDPSVSAPLNWSGATTMPLAVAYATVAYQAAAQGAQAAQQSAANAATPALATAYTAVENALILAAQKYFDAYLGATSGAKDLQGTRQTLAQGDAYVKQAGAANPETGGGHYTVGAETVSGSSFLGSSWGKAALVLLGIVMLVAYSEN